jgi:hypothetical protein
MTGVLATPPARALDVRVADSPLVGIRFFIDSRIADLTQVLADLQRERALTVERAQRLRALFRRNEEARRELLYGARRPSLAPVRRCLLDGVEIGSELGRLDERLEGLRRLEASLRKEQTILFELVSQLVAARSDGEVEVDGRASRRSQATRRLQRVVGEQHEVVEHAMLEGPLQRLSDAVLDAEVAARERGDQGSARERLAHCRAATVAAQEDLERLLRSCRPLPEGTTLVGAIRTLVAETPGAVSTRLRVLGAERELPGATELAAYRITEEAVDNAIRHARAGRLEVVLAFHRDRLALVVKDDGDGFDVVATRARLGRSHSFGLVAMASRAHTAGGQLDVRSALGAGTEVRATLPVASPTA